MLSAQAKKCEGILNFEIRGVRDRPLGEATWVLETPSPGRNADPYRITEKIKLRLAFIPFTPF